MISFGSFFALISEHTHLFPITLISVKIMNQDNDITESMHIHKLY